MTLLERCLAVAIIATLASFPQLRAQGPGLPPVEWVLEQQDRERWLHGSQLATYTPFKPERRVLLVDSMRGEGKQRRFHITLRRTANGRDSAVVVSDETGRVLRLDVGLAPYKRVGPGYAGDSVFSEERRRVSLDGYMTLAATRVWDFVVTFPQRARIGTRWTDTIARVANDGQYSQTISGRRVSRIVGDTVIDGLRLWIVSDSAYVTYQERRPERERTLDTLAHVSRSVGGVVRGVHFYDPVRRLLRARYDTANLSGDAVLRYPDGRSFRTPARYERIRRWRLHDSAQYTARRAALRTEAENEMGGMVMFPRSDLERRLARNDRRLRDSLMTVLNRTTDGDEMVELFRTMMLWGGRDSAFSRRLDSTRIARGDTAYLYQRLANRAYSRHPPTTVADVRAMIPFMEDPGRAWSLNVSRDWIYENLVQGLTTWPRAAASGRDTASVACTADACRLLGEMRASAREPRTRDVALVALFSVAPATWGDTIVQLAGPRHPLLRSAAALTGGVGATWPAASKKPIPPPESDWRSWLHWMDGRDTAYIRAQVALGPVRRLPLDTLPRARFEETHRTAIRMHMSRTGRDLMTELRRGYDQATNDTARLVFGTMLHGLDALQMSEAEMADAFASGLPGRVALARRVLLESFGDSATPMPEPQAAEIVDRMLSVIVDSAPMWRVGTPDLSAGRGTGLVLHARKGRVLIDAAHLPASVREKWGSRVSLIEPVYPRVDEREAAVTYTVSPVLRFGRFALVNVELSEQLQRAEHQAPAAYAAGTTLYLMHRGGEWVIVAWESWVT